MRWESITYLQTPNLLAGYILRVLFDNRRQPPIFATEEIEIHQSMDSAPVVNIANRNPFACAPLPAGNNEWVPNMEFSATTAHFGRPVPTTNYFWLDLGINNTPTKNCARNTISHTTGQQPLHYVWDTLAFQVTALESHAFMQLPAFKLPNLPHDDKADWIVTKRPRLATPEEHPPIGTNPVADPKPGPSSTSTNRWWTRLFKEAKKLDGELPMPPHQNQLLSITFSNIARYKFNCIVPKGSVIKIKIEYFFLFSKLVGMRYLKRPLVNCWVNRKKCGHINNDLAYF
jgi:hypothetical protein